MPNTPPSSPLSVAGVDALFAGIMSGERVSAAVLPGDRPRCSAQPVTWVHCDNCDVEQVGIATFRGEHDYRSDFADPSAVAELVRRTRQKAGTHSVALCDLCLAAVSAWSDPEPVQGRLEGV
jgi:hypothetical protein